MEISSLKTILSVAENQSYSKAALTLGCSVSVASKLVWDAEKELGVDIFDQHEGGGT